MTFVWAVTKQPATASTISAATLVLIDIICALDEGQHCAALFIDLERLASLGLDQNACNWFTSYLFPRTQCVVADCTQSTFLNVTKGIPQGSVLGPLLFTLYVKNIVSFDNGFKAHFYADDTVLNSSASTLRGALANLQSAFVSIQHSLSNFNLF